MEGTSLAQEGSKMMAWPMFVKQKKTNADIAKVI